MPMPPTNLRNTKGLLLGHLAPGSTITIPVNMARNATSASISSASSPASTPTTRRATAWRASLLAQIGPRQPYITTGPGNPRPPTNIDVELAEREREREKAKDAKVAAAKLDKEKARREKAEIENRTRIDAADGEVGGNPRADPNSKMGMNISFGSTDSDGSVMHHEKDGGEDGGHGTSRTKLLAAQNQGLAKRVEALEAETSSLLHTRALEHDRLKSINAALISKLADSRAAAASAAAAASIWEGQMMDRDGEVQRLRAVVAGLQEEADERRGTGAAGGSQAAR